MKITEDIRSVTYLKSRAAEVLRQIGETHRPVIITQNGEPRAVLQDPETYERTKNALALLRLLAHSEQAATEGRVVPQKEVFAAAREKLRKAGRADGG